MLGYYVVKNAKNDWHVKFSRFGCNSYIVETFKSAKAARYYAMKANSEKVFQ
jgi:hypothetical protein